jgi:flagellar basal body-associated protein FliL
MFGATVAPQTEEKMQTVIILAVLLPVIITASGVYMLCRISTAGDTDKDREQQDWINKHNNTGKGRSCKNGKGQQ